MEGVGAAATIIAIIQLTGKVTSLTYGYIGGVKRAPKDLKDLADELKSLENVLNVLKNYTQSNPVSTALETLTDNDGPLLECAQELEKLRIKLEQKGGQGLRQKVKSLMRGLMWPFDENETLQLISRIERHKSLFNLALTIDQASRSKKMEARLEELQTEAAARGQKDDIRRIAEKRQKVLDWLCAENLDDKHLEISHKRQRDTGLWLLGAPEFKEWINGKPNHQLLWGYGIPGAGKTFLSSLVIDHLEGQASTANYGVAYIYFGYKEQDQQKPVHVLASLIKQLASQKTYLPTAIEDLYDSQAQQNKRPILEDLYGTLIATSNSFTRVFFAFDALDECHPENQRRELLPLFHRMGSGGFSLFLTSRQHPEDIQISFRNTAKIALLAKEKDIETYIVERINENSRARRLIQQGNCQTRIISDLAIALRECGFLLVRFHIEFLCQQTTVRQIMLELDKFRNASTGKRLLDPTYDRAMETLHSQPKNCVDLALNTLSWLVKARRTLTVDEIRTALAIEPKRYELDDWDLPDRATLLDVCAGLVMIDENTNTIRLAHYTVQEYLLHNVIIPEDVEFRLAMACTTYLSFDVFGQACDSKLAFRDRYERYPFLKYAIYFDFHIKKVNEVLSAEFVLRFLGTPGCISSYLQIQRCFGDGLSEEFGGFYPRTHTPLHVASGIGHCTVMRLILEGTKCSDSDSDEWKALCLATTGWDDAHVRRILEENADISVTDSDGTTALHMAASAGIPLPVQLLLEKSADISVRDGYGRTALHKAATGGHETVARLLLENGADVSAQDDDRRTALHQAASGGHETVAWLLLENGADVSAQGIFGMTALHQAASEGHETVAQLLLENGADVSAQDDSGRTALHWTASEGHETVAWLLLDNGADVSVQGIYGTTALHQAANSGHETVARLLLENGANVSAQGIYGTTALHRAANGGHETVAQLLLENGAGVSVQDDYGRTALHRAANGGHETVARLLLENGADISTQDDSGSTALHWTASEGHETMAQLLLEKGADVKIQDGDGMTALHLAADKGHEGVVKLLGAALLN